MKGFVVGIGVTLLALACGAWVTSTFGLYPIGADNPPGTLETVLAQRAMDVYAAKHKPSGNNPVQATPAALSDGAEDYEEHCAFCHGGAKASISPMRDKFNPPAPQFIDRIPHDDDAWLFWVTKHGIRMSGMPTWDGVLSDDEIWKVVAFIKHTDTLPPEVRSLWERIAAKPGEIGEHTAEQHQHRTKDDAPKR